MNMIWYRPKPLSCTREVAFLWISYVSWASKWSSKKLKQLWNCCSMPNTFHPNCSLCCCTADSQELVPLGDKSQLDGWHFIQFSGGKQSPTKFYLNLRWSSSNIAHSSEKTSIKTGSSPLLLKLRTDVNKITPEVERLTEKLPQWCSPFGKSTSPYTLAFLTTLPVDF